MTKYLLILVFILTSCSKPRLPVQVPVLPPTEAEWKCACPNDQKPKENLQTDINLQNDIDKTDKIIEDLKKERSKIVFELEELINNVEDLKNNPHAQILSKTLFHIDETISEKQNKLKDLKITLKENNFRKGIEKWEKIADVEPFSDDIITAIGAEKNLEAYIEKKKIKEEKEYKEIQMKKIQQESIKKAYEESIKRSYEESIKKIQQESIRKSQEKNDQYQRQLEELKLELRKEYAKVAELNQKPEPEPKQAELKPTIPIPESNQDILPSTICPKPVSRQIFIYNATHVRCFYSMNINEQGFFKFTIDPQQTIVHEGNKFTIEFPRPFGYCPRINLISTKYILQPYVKLPTTLKGRGL